MRLEHITLQQARAINAFSPARWTIAETPDGWKVRRGGATLTAVNSKRERVFVNIETAIKRLRTELGVTEFNVEAMKEVA